jgi:hypothetical protein
MSDDIKPTNVTEEEKIEFYKAFLSDKPFYYTDKLFNDQFKITYRTLTAKETNDIFNQLRKDQMAERLTNDAAYSLALTSFRLAVSITSINDVDFQPEITSAAYKPKDNDDSYIKARAKVLEDWSIFKLSAIADSFKIFEDKVITLVKEMSNPSFWKAAK